jgi:hypothetical protein
MVLLGYEAQVEACFSKFGDSANLDTRMVMVFVSVQDRCRVCSKRAVCSEIVSDAPNGTPRLRDPSGSSFWSIWRKC